MIRLRHGIALVILVAGTIALALALSWPRWVGRFGGEPFQSAAARSVSGPLRVSVDNPRYFEDPQGEIRYLTGSHTWSNLQDMGFGHPPPAFDYEGWLAFCERYDMNFFRLWMAETQQASPKSAEHGFYDHHAPIPWNRPGPGLAADGLPRYDLSSFNAEYFTRLRERVRRAGERGIYVSVMLFNGWSVEEKGAAFGSPWFAHPFHRGNNINGIDGDLNNDGSGGELHTLDQPEVTALQESYVRRVVDTIGDLENVLYEISNESSMASIEWQYSMIEFLKEYQTENAQHHPVGMTVPYPDGDNAPLFESPADWISPIGDILEPPISEGRKVILADTDHICGVCGRVDWIWRSFLRGLNPVLMDPYDGSAVGSGPGALGSLDDRRWNTLRANLGYTRAFAQRIDLKTAVPRPDLVSHGDCLSDAGRTATPHYLVFLPAGEPIELDLNDAALEFEVEWLDPRRGKVHRRNPIRGGAHHTLRAPFRGDAVAFLTPSKALSP